MAPKYSLTSCKMSPDFDCVDVSPSLIHGGDGVDGMMDGFETHAPLSCHDYTEAKIDDISPFIIDLSDTDEEEVYTPPPTKTTFAGQGTPVLVNRGGVEDATMDNFELKAPLPRHSDVDCPAELVGLGEWAAVGNGDVPPDSINTTGDDVYSTVYSPNLTRTTVAGPNTPLAEQIGFDEVTTPMMSGDDIVMMDAGDTPNICTTNDTVSAPLRGKVTIKKDNEKKPAPVMPDGAGGFQGPAWMAGFLQPSFLHDLVACNLKGITVESDKIHFSFV